MGTPDPYTGIDNLEVMREARNYNGYLLGLLRTHAAPGGKTLDFGAGAGTFALPLHAEGMLVTGLEPDPQLSGMLIAGGVPAVTRLSDLTDASFDFVYSLNVLEHIDDDAGALAGVYSKLKPGGRLLVYVPAFAILFTSMDVKVGHLRRYRRAGLEAVVRGAGFEVEKSGYADFLGFFATLAFRMVGTRDGSLGAGSVKFYDRFVFPVSRVLDRVFSSLLGKNVLIVARRR